ncbi:MAG: DNA (cytosine-5-)-methyltransferase, partial [Deltaproteobacteria bacterium]
MMMTMKPKATYGVIDLFAGPGGLAEGFARYRDSSGHYPFRIRLSVEKDKSAHATLQLRAFTRQFPYESPLPPEYLDLLAGQTRIDALSARYPAQW